ncbi:restriction endonuclease [Sulfurihydrogenibium sp. YO3AOP1]|uniref:restriction endonuclease n=1 Tax=Sulfurihydrogenibium sp. (strain YO3AOP1) TaxID=436114 RepID=UPI0001725AB3|nr:restriction endonuclease [Sulfurihydrogenibium sp. YO3AOP1]ACD65793.1 restriction endonuclease [Sulfurihydrogenibium sp. YO3AOP1]
MAIPGYQDLMLPLLKLVSDGKEYSLREIIERLAEEFNLSEEDRNEFLPSGQQRVFDNRVNWAKTYLLKAGLLESPKRGYIKISKAGKQFLVDNPNLNKLTKEDLMQFESFREFISRGNKKNMVLHIDSETPTEIIEQKIQEVNEALADELLRKIKGSSPKFFEKLVIDLLLKMGYGGSEKEMAEVVGKSGDEGIDGTIKEDKLGLDVIYIQAKRWEGPVGRPEIQKFVGALAGKKAKKGVFFTTSTFTDEAKDYVSHLEQKVVLIDGNKSADLMIKYNVGISVEKVIEIKRIDSDYFEEDII